MGKRVALWERAGTERRFCGRKENRLELQNGFRVPAGARRGRRHSRRRIRPNQRLEDEAACELPKLPRR